MTKQQEQYPESISMGNDKNMYKPETMFGTMNWPKFMSKDTSISDSSEDITNGSSTGETEKGHTGSENEELKQSIKPYHVFMITMATGIGTGLLVGNGKSIADAGVGGTLVSYFIIGSMLICCMQSVGELVVAFPSLAGGFNSYGKRFVDPSFGFTVAWLFCLQWQIVLPLELVTASMTIKYWNDSLNPSIFVAIFYSLILGISFFGARGYADAEFLFNLSKVLMITGFIILGIIINFGAAGTSGYIGIKYLKTPGAFNTRNTFKSMCTTLVNACFSCGGVEFLALSAAEQARGNISKSIKRACGQVLVRMCIFYILSIFVIGLLVPYNSPELMGSSSEIIHSSPYVIAVASHGVKVVPHLINAVILIAVVSVANSAMYSSSRTLHALAEQGFAPSYFAKLDSQGRPFRCLVVSGVFGLLSFIAEYKDQESVFVWLLSISGLSTIFTWTMICVAHLRFRAAMKDQNHSLEELGHRAWSGTYGSYYVIAINSLTLVVQFWVSLFPLDGDGRPDVVNFFQNYMAVPFALCLYVGHKIYTRSWQLIIPADKIDVDTSRDIYGVENRTGHILMAHCDVNNPNGFKETYKMEDFVVVDLEETGK